jgi:sulfur carrier protein ThiS
MMRVNGKDLCLSGEHKLSDFLLSQGYQERQVVVELNEAILSLRDFQGITINLRLPDLHALRGDNYFQPGKRPVPGSRGVHRDD